jgi:hypothetical protein
VISGYETTEKHFFHTHFSLFYFVFASAVVANPSVREDPHPAPLFQRQGMSDMAMDTGEKMFGGCEGPNAM